MEKLKECKNRQYEDKNSKMIFNDFDGSFLPRSLVVFNAKKAWNIDIKVRNTDIASVLKAYLKALLGEEAYKYNFDTRVVKREEEVEGIRRVSASLAGTAIAVTNSEGCIIDKSILYLYSGETFKKTLQYKKSTACALVTCAKLSFEDPRVISALNNLVKGNVKLLTYVQGLDEVIAKISKSHEAEEEATKKKVVKDKKTA